MYKGRGKAGKGSPSRKSVANWRPGSAKRVLKARTVTSSTLTKATKTLSNVAVDTSTQRGNIKVVVRVRPPNEREKTANSRLVVHTIDNHMVVFDPPEEDKEFYYHGVKQKNYQQKGRHKNVKLAFDNVYGHDSTNPQIYDDVIKPMLDTLLSGFNCSVFAYGATGSGKTHTMLGHIGNPGLTFLTVMGLYERLEEMNSEYETEIAVAYLEVYNETVKDLLHASGDLNLREDHNGVVVPNLTTHKPKDSAELLNLLAFGNSVRSQHPTDHNAESSRSHAVFQVYVTLRSRCTELTNKYKSAKLVMVDLAGSERGAATGFHGQRFREGASINKSLLALGNCINALADGKKHIPYRDSKLTRILKDSLGGNCKTVMVANVSPSNLSYDDSYNTLRYADRAKRIKCQVKPNTMSVTACLTQYTKIVEEMTQKIDHLQNELNECHKNCRCKNEKVDAATEPDDSMERKDNWLNRPVVSGTVVNRYSDLIQRKKEAVRMLLAASATAETNGVKIRVKERRIGSIKKFSTSVISQDKNTSKFRNQLKPLTSRRKEALAEKSKALQVMTELDQQCEDLQAQNLNESINYVPLKLSEYLELQNMKVEVQKLEMLKNFYKQTTRYFLDEWQKTETFVSKSAEFLTAQYLQMKHLNHNSSKMDRDYEGLTAYLCGTHVHWTDDMDGQDMDANVPPLGSLLEEENLLENDSCGDENAELHVTNKEQRIRFRRPATPPRKNMKTYVSPPMVELTFEDPSELDSFASETSVLNTSSGSGDMSTNEDDKPLETLDNHLNTSSVPLETYGNLDSTITLEEPTIPFQFSPKKNDVSYQASCSGLEFNSQANGSIEMNRQDCGESFGPVPLFLTDRSYMKLEISDEQPKSLSKENIDPSLTFRKDEELEADVCQAINSTFSLGDRVNHNSTFQVEAVGGGGPPVSLFGFKPALIGPLLPIVPNLYVEGVGDIPKSSGSQNRNPVRKIPTSTHKQIPRGRSPVTTSNPNFKMHRGTFAVPSFHPPNRISVQPRPGNATNSSGLTDQRFNSQNSTIPWRM